MTTSYDPECEALARYFLFELAAAGDDFDHYFDESQVHELAGVIQQAIEDWFFPRPSD